MYSVRAILRSHGRLIFFVFGLIIIFFVVYALRSALIPFILGLTLAYLLLPVITWVERKLPRQGRLMQTKRVSLVILTFIVILGLVGFFSYFIVVAVIEAFVVLVQNAPQYISAGLLALGEWAEGFRQYLPPEMQQQIDQLILDAGQAVGNAIREVFMRGISFIPTTFSLIFGFASLPIFLFYILKDSGL